MCGGRIAKEESSHTDGIGPSIRGQGAEDTEGNRAVLHIYRSST